MIHIFSFLIQNSSLLLTCTFSTQPDTSSDHSLATLLSQPRPVLLLGSLPDKFIIINAKFLVLIHNSSFLCDFDTNSSFLKQSSQLSHPKPHRKAAHVAPPALQASSSSPTSASSAADTAEPTTSAAAAAAVSHIIIFQQKNHHFLLKNRHFLLKNHHFYTKSSHAAATRSATSCVFWIIKSTFFNRKSRFLIANQDSLTGNQDSGKSHHEPPPARSQCDIASASSISGPIRLISPYHSSFQTFCCRDLPAPVRMYTQYRPKSGANCGFCYGYIFPGVDTTT